MRKAGRPTKFTPELCEKILELLRAGYSISRVFRVVPVARQKFYEHLKRNPNFGTTVPKLHNSKENFSELPNRCRKALVIAAIHEGHWTKADIQAYTGLSEWVVRVILDELESQGLVKKRRQSSAGAVNPLLYSLA
ncbi:MAG: hypothetical protein K1Y36_10420 [Blastocatellia bacterium]|nr:hypothetical protein [Blastocatellia bacterium]